VTARDDIDSSRPHPARVYDYWLDGSNHYEVDAAAAEQVVRVWPGVVLGAQLNRAFMHRATRWLVREAGVRQFLDIGAGIPPNRTCTRSRRPSRPRPVSSTPTTTR
jgi:hypothetical protein